MKQHIRMWSWKHMFRIITVSWCPDDPTVNFEGWGHSWLVRHLPRNVHCWLSVQQRSDPAKRRGLGQRFYRSFSKTQADDDQPSSSSDFCSQVDSRRIHRVWTLVIIDTSQYRITGLLSEGSWCLLHWCSLMIQPQDGNDNDMRRVDQPLLVTI